MSETRATATAVFPPGRYGHRRDGRTRRTVPAIILALVVLASVALTIKLYQQYGKTDYQAQIVGWDPPTDTRIQIRFTVVVPPGAPARCTLRARDYQGNEVGREDVVVRPAGQASTIDAHQAVSTTARASVGEVLGCRPAG